MRRVFIKIGIYLAAIAVAHLIAAYSADERLNASYGRFINGTHQALVIGTSRAAQGLDPESLNDALGSEYAEIGNFSFSIVQSPFGQTYYDAIQKKLDKTETEKKRLFIVTVDPWSISDMKNKDGQPSLRDEASLLGKIKSVDNPSKPNYEYLLREYPSSWGQILSSRLRPGPFKVHRNGWLEVFISDDEKTVRQRTKRKIDSYRRDNLPRFGYSSKRFSFFTRLIDELSEVGDVVVVRMPLDPGILEIENKLMGDFNGKICSALRARQEIRYFDYSDETKGLVFSDGNHIHRKYVKGFSKRLAADYIDRKKSSC